MSDFFQLKNVCQTTAGATVKWRHIRMHTYWMLLYSSRIFICIGADLSRSRSRARVCSSFLRPDLFRPAKPKSICSSDTLKVITMFCNTNHKPPDQTSPQRAHIYTFQPAQISRLGNTPLGQK